MGCYDWALHKEMAMIDDISGDVIMKNKAILGSKTPYKWYCKNEFNESRELNEKENFRLSSE